MIDVSRAGQSYGPYSTEVARAYFQTGNIRPDDLVCSDEENAWQPAQNHHVFTEAKLPDPPTDLPSRPQEFDTENRKKLLDVLQQCLPTNSPEAKAQRIEGKQPLPKDIPEKRPETFLGYFITFAMMVAFIVA